MSWRGWWQATVLQCLMGAQVFPVQSPAPRQLGKGFLGAGSPSPGRVKGRPHKPPSCQQDRITFRGSNWVSNL